MVRIQLQDITGNWRDYGVTLNISAMILNQMQQLAARFPNQRVRAVDMDNRLIDIL